MGVSSGVGLVSGLDYETLISQLTAVSRRPITLLEGRISSFETKRDAYGILSQRLTTLRDQLNNLLDPEDFQTRSATSSSDAITISAEADAEVGSFEVEILQLASAQRLASQGVNGSDATIASAAGSFSFEVGENSGNVQSYSVDETTTLADLRDLINSDENSKVRATILDDGSATNSSRLVLTSSETGAANAIRFLGNDTTLDFENKTIEAATADSGNQFDGSVTASGSYTGSGSRNIVLKAVEGGASGDAGPARFVVSTDGGISFGSTEYAFSETAQAIPGADGVEVAFGAGTQDVAVGDTFRIDVFDPTVSEARDAVARVEGIQITRSSNTFNDVLEGVSFTAEAVTDGAETLSVSRNTGRLNGALTQFQTDYNALVEALSELSSYDSETRTATALFGDSAVRQIRSDLSRIVTDPIPGLSGEYTTLRSIGFSLNRNGTLNLDQARISEVNAADPSAIQRVFSQFGSSSTPGLEFVNSTDATASRNYTVEVTRVAERALIDGNQAIQASGLAADENLTFTIDAETFSVSLSAGDDIEAIVEQINGEFSNRGLSYEAVNEDGVLRLQSQGYGAAYSLQVTSDQSGAGAGQTGIGTTQRSSTGVDVAGRIGGQFATGEGQILKGGTTTSAEGIEIRVTATETLTGSVSFTRGIADRMLDRIASYLDSETGLLTAREEGIDTSIERLNERIGRLEERVSAEAARYRRQFTALEQQLAALNDQGSFINGAISQLQNSRQ